MARARTWLVVAGVLLALFAGALALVTPWFVRRVYAPIARIKSTQGDFEEWARRRDWHEPATPGLSAAKLDAFLALRRDLIALEAKAEALQGAVPEGTKPGLREVAGIMEGVGGLVTGQLEAHRRHDITLAEYAYLKRLVYRSWLAALVAQGVDPAARERAAQEIETAADAEPSVPVRQRLRQVAAALRARQPPAPEGVPQEVHERLLARAADIQALAESDLPPRGRRRGTEPR